MPFGLGSTLVTTLQGDKVTLLSGQVQGASNAANIVTVHVIASKGVVQCTSLHGSVLPPEAPLPGHLNILQLALSRPELLTLAAALKGAGLVPSSKVRQTCSRSLLRRHRQNKDMAGRLLLLENKVQLVEF